jgi:signal transduction histidine kinase
MTKSETVNADDSTLLLTLLAICALSQCQPLDHQLAVSFCQMLAIDNAVAGGDAPNLPTWASLIRILFAIAYATVGYVCGQRVKGAAGMLVIAPIVGLSMILIIPWYHTIVPLLQPVTYLLLAAIGVVLGANSRRQGLIQEHAHTQQIESALRNRELLETRLQLIKQDEVERKMLAADLHDQVLNDLKFLLRMGEERKGQIDAAFLKDSGERLESAMDNIREVMESLCPSGLEHIGLIAALEDCLRDRADKAGFLPQFRSTLAEADINALSRTEKALLYRLVQESITNIAKHAKASKTRLTVDLEDAELHIRILDDGVGIQSEASEKSRGLQYMKLRAEIIGARIGWGAGADGRGTAVDIRINLAGRKANESTDS